MKKSRRSAFDFGDNPAIKVRFGEATGYNKAEPWERAYRRQKVRRHLRRGKNGRFVKVRTYRRR